MLGKQEQLVSQLGWGSKVGLDPEIILPCPANPVGLTRCWALASFWLKRDRRGLTNCSAQNISELIAHFPLKWNRNLVTQKSSQVFGKSQSKISAFVFHSFLQSPHFYTSECPPEVPWDLVVTHFLASTGPPC